MTPKTVNIGSIEIANDRPFTLIAGPCQMESREHAFEMCGALVEITNKLGIPFPKGTIRVFKEDEADGSLEFIGEDSIDHTPKDENITVVTGNAFDITANKYVTNYRSYDRGGYSADLNMTINNHKDISAEIVVVFSRYQGDNVAVNWQSTDLNIEKESATLWKIKRVFAANEKYSF